MRISATALKRIAELRKPANQVGVMLVPDCDMDTWERLARLHQDALMTACAEDRGEDEGVRSGQLDSPVYQSSLR